MNNPLRYIDPQGLLIYMVDGVEVDRRVYFMYLDSGNWERILYQSGGQTVAIVDRNHFYKNRTSISPSSPDTIAIDTFFDNKAFEIAITAFKALLLASEQKETRKALKDWAGFEGGDTGGGGVSDPDWGAGSVPKLVKHHIFPVFRGNSPKSQRYRDFFKLHNISVHNYTVKVPDDYHRQVIHGAGNNWVTRWKEWIDANPDATTLQVYQFGVRLTDEYKIGSLPYVPY